MTDSANKVGKQIAALLADPTRYGRAQLQAKLDRLVATQNEITTRGRTHQPARQAQGPAPGPGAGQQVRLSGVRAGAATGCWRHSAASTSRATARKLATLSGYFTGPDVYYNELYRTQAQKIMSADGVNNVAVPRRDLLHGRQPVLAERPDPAALGERVVVDQAHRRSTAWAWPGCRIKSNGKTVRSRRAAPTTSRPRSASSSS